MKSCVKLSENNQQFQNRTRCVWIVQDLDKGYETLQKRYSLFLFIAELAAIQAKSPNQ